MNATMKNLWKSEIVWVRYLKDNETVPDGDSFEEALEGRKKEKLKLTPPIIVAWTYHLARSLTEGIIY